MSNSNFPQSLRVANDRPAGDEGRRNRYRHGAETKYHLPYERLARRRIFQEVLRRYIKDEQLLKLDNFALFDAVAKRGYEHPYQAGISRSARGTDGSKSASACSTRRNCGPSPSTTKTTCFHWRRRSRCSARGTRRARLWTPRPTRCTSSRPTTSPPATTT